MTQIKIEKSVLERLYIENKKTDVQIAEILGCNKQTVYNTRKRFGIAAFKRWQRNVCEPTEHQLQIIYGSLLGDASVSNGKKGNHSCESIFELKHCPKQKEYVFWKYDQLKNLCLSEPKENNIGQWRLRTFHHPFFSNIRKSWYPLGTKIVLKELLDTLSPLGLAVWYMDDGSLSKVSNFIKLHTCSFSAEEHDTLSDWLQKKFGIKSSMKEYSGYRNLAIDLDSRVDFVKLIKPYVIPSMEYKITFREYHTWVN